MSEYYAGKGCTCAAHSESECCCRVDWTDPEIYKLQARIDELEVSMSELDHMKMMGECAVQLRIDELEADYRRALDRVGELESRLEYYTANPWTKKVSE